MKQKSPYHIRNWSEYNSSLKQLGSGAIWVSSEATAKATLEIVSVVDSANDAIDAEALPSGESAIG